LVELLKQPQYKPLQMEEQVAVVFAGVGGKVDDVEVAAVRRFESEMLEYLHAKHEAIFDEIRNSKDFSNDVKAKLSAAIDEFKKGFKA
jgi:F-type H+-transporting ATPase subunit alpha